jgi:hypothetical protein
LVIHLIFTSCREKRKEAQMTGIGFGLSACVLYFCCASCYTLGAYLIDNGEIGYKDMFR